MASTGEQAWRPLEKTFAVIKPDAVRAGCLVLASKWVSQGAVMVEKQPGMAYALAAVALCVGEGQPALWPCLLCALRTAALSARSFSARLAAAAASAASSRSRASWRWRSSSRLDLARADTSAAGVCRNV